MMIRSATVSAVILSTCCASAPTENQFAIRDGFKRCVVVQATEQHYSCSGVIVATNLVITAKHCIGGGMQVNGKAALVKRTSDDDIALLYTETPEFSTIEFDESPSVGDTVYEFGNFGDWLGLYSRGEVMQVSDRRVYSRTLSAPGVSGSAVYKNGRLVGIAVQYAATTFDAPNGKGQTILFGTAVPARKVRQLLQEPAIEASH